MSMLFINGNRDPGICFDLNDDDSRRELDKLPSYPLEALDPIQHLGNHAVIAETEPNFDQAA